MGICTFIKNLFFNIGNSLSFLRSEVVCVKLIISIINWVLKHCLWFFISPNVEDFVECDDHISITWVNDQSLQIGNTFAITNYTVIVSLPHILTYWLSSHRHTWTSRQRCSLLSIPVWVRFVYTSCLFLFWNIWVLCCTSFILRICFWLMIISSTVCCSLLIILLLLLWLIVILIAICRRIACCSRILIIDPALLI